MVYPQLTLNWTLPTQHERKVYSTKIYEIFYQRIFLFLVVLSLTALIFLLTRSFLALISAFLLFVILFPLFVRPWDIVLSNKRLILRHQYWNIGRFSTIRSFNLSKLDSQRITPRIKLIPITLGFSLIFGFSFVLFDFIISGSVPVPLYLKVVFLFDNFIPYLSILDMTIEDTAQQIFSPFLEYGFAFAIVFFLTGLGLILFGMPRREVMVLTTTGGHRFSINAGIPEKLTELLYAIGRKHRVMEDMSSWEWQVPLLDDEELRITSKVGLIDRGSQLLGFVSFVLFLDSLDQLVNLVLNFSLANFVILLMRIFDFFFILVAIILAKKYRRITATNHRLIYQEERREISGLWGRRIYQYSDLPFKYIQGFTYSNFAGIRASAIVGSIVLYIGGLSLAGYYQSPPIIGITLIIVIIYFAISYRITTLLAFKSLSGDTIRIFYHLPFFMEKLSHKLEDQDWLYNLLFPNILSEEEIVTICNSIRNVQSPHQDPTIEHEITYHGFIDTSEGIRHKWEKIGPYRYAKQSIILGGVISLVSIIFFTSILPEVYKIPFLGIAVIIVLPVVFRNYVFKRRSLVILENRLFHIDEILPRRLSQFFGILPERSISEVDLEFTLVSQFRYFFGEKLPFFIRHSAIYIVLIVTTIGVFNSEFFDNLTKNIILFTLYLMLVLYIPNLVRDFFGSIPRYGLVLYTRFGTIKFPYINQLEEFQQSFTEVRL